MSCLGRRRALLPRLSFGLPLLLPGLPLEVPDTSHHLSYILLVPCGGLVIDYSGQKLRLRSEQRGNPSGHWTASWAGSVYPTPMSVRRDRRSKRPSRTGLQTICRKISQTLCRQRLSVEGSHKGRYPCAKEPSGLIRTDGKRPDGATLVSWARGKYIAWDFTAIHTCAASYLHLSSSVPGGAAEHAADRKRNKYAILPASYEFVPIAVETLGPSTVRVASSCWDSVVVGLGGPAIQERLFSCFNDCQYASSALMPSLTETPSQRTPRTRKSLLDYIHNCYL